MWSTQSTSPPPPVQTAHLWVYGSLRQKKVCLIYKYYLNPIILHATCAACFVKKSSQTEPHMLLICISSLPSLVEFPPTNLSLTGKTVI